MKIRSLAATAVTLATFSLLSAPVFAEDAPSSPPPHEEEMGQEIGKGGPRASEMEKRKAEMEQRGKERFEKTDSNHDGFLNKEEMEAEHKARLDDMFVRTDTNKDGKLSSEELKKGREEMRAKYKERMKERHEQKADEKADSKSAE
jgi:hypothetical protein